MKYVKLALILVVSLLCLQCEVFLDDNPPDCEQGIEKYYDEGCVIPYEDGYLAESAAEDLCEEALDDAREEGCETKHAEWVLCMTEKEGEDCADCFELLIDLIECVTE